jgi:2-keto-4-pentenoate hydratase
MASPNHTASALSGDAIAQLAERLFQAHATGEPIPPLSSGAELTVQDAYAIQQQLVRRQREAGRAVVGRKVGLTSKAMQDALGVDQPDFGLLFADMLLPDGAQLGTGDFIAPRVEPEIAFRLGRDLRGPGIDADDVRAAVDAVYPSLEIIDSRIADWKITLVDTIADNASCGAFVLGAAVDWADIDLAAVECALSVDGTVVETGLGAAVLGHPFNAVAWLANTLAELGEHISAGDVVLPGSCTRAVPATAGSEVLADFGPLGTVSVSVAGEGA